MAARVMPQGTGGPAAEKIYPRSVQSETEISADGYDRAKEFKQLRGTEGFHFRRGATEAAALDENQDDEPGKAHAAPLLLHNNPLGTLQ